MVVRKCSIILSILFFYNFNLSAFGAEHYISQEVNYKTEDGWVISGTLRLPLNAGKNDEFPAMILLHEKEHERLDGGDIDSELALKLPIEAGIATLAIDWRGREKSMGNHQPVPDEMHDFSTKLKEKMYLDVKGAMTFLANYKGVDRLRIGNCCFSI